MIFQHTIDKVLSGEQTKTSRIVKDGDIMLGADHKPFVMNFGRIRYGYGDYAVQPGHGKKAVARMNVLDIRRWDVRNCDAQTAKEEGFPCAEEFWLTWIGMHDKATLKDYIAYQNELQAQAWPMLKENWTVEQKLNRWLWQRLHHQPLERYQAWQLTFERVAP